MEVGFIGLGIMGNRMASNLLRKGYNLVIYNRTRTKEQNLLKMGAKRADSPTDLAKKADILFTMLSTPEAVVQIASGQKGFLSSLKKNALWVDCSTVNPSFTKQMALEAGKRDIRFLDAPVAGTKGPAETGQLVILVGGDQKDLQECRPLLETMGKTIVYVGEHGMGSAMKMVVNLMLGGAMTAFAEALSLGEALGISKETLFNTLLGGPVAAPFLSAKRQKITNGDYEADFPLRWMHKDLQLVAATGYENNLALPVTNSVKELFALAKSSGLGDKDFSAVYAFLQSNRNE